MENTIDSSLEPQQKEGPDIGVWLKRIQDSEKYMAQHFKPRWQLARERIRSEACLETRKQGKPSHNQVNLAYSIGSNFVNSAFFKNPEINLTARDEAQREQVENTEAKINEFLKDNHIKRTVKRIIWDAYKGGFGARYVDYEYREYESNEILTDQLGQPVLGGDRQPQKKRVITKNAPILKRVRPDLLRFPRGFDFDEADECPWIGFDLWMPVADVQNNQELDADFRAQIKGQAWDDLDKDKGLSEKNKSDLMYAKLHYVFTKPEFDGDVYKLLILCDEVKDKAGKITEFEKGQVGYPIKFLYFNPLDDDVSYPCGDVWLFESQLYAIDEWWRRMVNHVKRSHPKNLYNIKDVDAECMKSLKSNRDLEWVGCEPKSGRSLGDVFHVLEHPPLHKDNHTLFEVARNLLSEIGPRSAMARGGQDAQVDTATEANIINANEVIDLDARVDAIRDFFADIAVDLAGLYQKNLVKTTTVSGKTKTGEQFRREIGRDGFTTDFQMPDVNVESMQAPNKEVYRAQLERDMQTLAGFIEPQLQKKGETIDWKFFVQKWFDVMNVKNADQAIIPLNIRNPNKEHEDYVFGKNADGSPLPMIVQQHEDHDEHLREHEMVGADEIASSVYEGLRPGFKMALAQHVFETKGEADRKAKNKMPEGGKTPTAKNLLPAQIGAANRRM